MQTPRLPNSRSFCSVVLLLALCCLGQARLLAAEGVIRLVRGGLWQQVYLNIPGLTVADLTNSAKFPDYPDSTNIIGMFETPMQIGDFYGQRISGYVAPPVTGDYVFYLAADDQALLYLSPSLSPSEKVLIAKEQAWSFPRSWVGLGAGRTNSENISRPIRLEAGQAYYVEALHKEGMGQDHFGVAWQLPGAPAPVNGSDPIMGEFLGYALQTNYPPEVALVNPAEGAVFAAGGNVALRASAASRDAFVSEVRFYANTNLLGIGRSLSSDPRSFLLVWSNVPAGRFELTAQATDTAGLTETSAPVHITVTNGIPGLQFQLSFFTCDSPCPNGQLYYRNYTPAGPEQAGALLPGLRVQPDASHRYFYANRQQSVLKIDAQLGIATELRLPPSVPELSWPMGMAYDSTRNRVLLASLGGEGYLYAYAPEQDLWTLVASMNDRDVDSIVYHKPQDAIYAFEVHRGVGPGRLYKLSASGVYQSELQLPPIPVDVGVYPYRSEMVSVGDYILLLIGPELNTTPPAPQHEYIFVIDTRSGVSWLTFHRVGEPEVPVAPVITKQPVSQQRYAGRTASFSVEASGTAPLNYSWRHDGVLIPNAASPTLSLANAAPSDSGQYAATVSNSAGSAASQAATLTVVPIPTTFPPSVSIPVNCGPGGYGSSNYKLADLGGDAVELHVVGVYEGIAHVDGVVKVKVNATPKPVVLALSAYQPVIWTVTLAPAARLSAVYVSGPYNPQVVVGVPLGVPVYQVSFGAYAYGWEPDRNTGGGSYQTLIRNIRSITGLVESSFQGCYAGNEFEIPYAVPQNTPPSVVCEGSRTVLSTSANGLFETIRASVRDAEGDAVTTVWFVDGIAKATNNLPLGATFTQIVSFDDWFTLGAHTVMVTATDGRSQPQSCSMVLTVLHSPQQGLVVTSEADSGPGTLRNIVAAAPPGATIQFAIRNAINLTSGEIEIKQPLNIEGPGAQALAVQRADTAPPFRLFNIKARGVAISALTLRNGFVNEADTWKFGGGILNNGALVLSRCVVSDNRASAEYSRGGAICNQSGAGLMVLQCLFVSNSTPAYYGEAGAIYNYGQLAVTNTTFSGNSAGSWGGAVHNDMMSAGCWLDSCTFSLNSGSAGGAVFNRGAPPNHTSPVGLRNNILVGNTPDDLSHCSIVVSGGYNLIGKISDPYGSLGLPIARGPGDRFDVTPEQVRLGSLQMNGGTTRTHALLRRSIAIDAGPESGPPSVDQRGVPRPYGPRLDIGAFESNVEFPDNDPELACPGPATWHATSNSGATGTLTAQVRDIDGDPLVVTWVVDGTPRRTNSYPNGSVSWTNVSLTLALGAGRHQVAVSVSDGTPPAASCVITVEVLAVPESWVTRKISGNSVQLIATPPAGTAAWAVEETPPQNWAIVGITNGVFDTATGKVKFGPFFDGERRPLGYVAMPPPGFMGIGLFSGVASANGKSTPVVGDDRIVIPWPHPADINPGDWMMRINEVTAYAAAWRTGGVWVSPPNPIPMNYVTRAASLWQKGEAYTMDPAVGGPPAWWVSLRPKASLSLKNGGTGSGTRCAPLSYVPGQSFEILVQATASPDAGVFALEESVPAGWRVASISHGGQFDSVNRQIKWGPFFDSLDRTLSYRVVPPVDAHGKVALAGSASFDGQSVPITGRSQLACGSSLRWVSKPVDAHWTLQLQGELGTSYLVESSTDLLQWSPVVTVTNSSGSVDIPVSTAGPSRLYYRARAMQ